MRTRTVVAVIAVAVVLAGVIAVALGTGGSVTLVERWVSDTARDTEVNHHPIGVGPTGDLVAPVTAVPDGADAEMTVTDCALVSLAPANGSVRWRHGVDPDRCYSHAVTEPAIADLDGDGRPEVAASTTENALVVLDGPTGREKFRVSQPVYGYSPPTVADVLPPAGREIVASDIGGNVVLVRANGSVAWRRALNETVGSVATVWDAPVVADVDGDTRREIVLAANGGLVVLATDGTVEWVGTTGATYVVDAQADADPARELFAIDGTTVRAVDGASHDRAWGRDFGIIPRIQAASDVDGDGAVELLVGLPNGTAVSLMAATGEVEWSTRVTAAEDAVLAAPVVATADGGNGTAVVTAARDGTVALLDPTTGAERAAYERDVPVWTYPTPADLDDDGTDEILVRYGDGRVVALDPVA